MSERKQDAINESMLRALMDEQQDENQIQRELNRTHQSHSTFETLAKRIVNDARTTQTHLTVANSVLNNIGVDITPKKGEHNPLRHVGKRAQKIPIKTRKVRKVKRQSRAPLRTRHRPAVGNEQAKMSLRRLRL
ncbi:MAG: hypothetical protein ACPHUK_06340 [Candidatus Poseidoniaceae archaeon]